MPYKSEAQRRFFNSPAGKEKLGEEEVEHWNEVSKGMKLPEKAIDRAIRILDEGRSGVHRITYKDIDGKKQVETIKGSVEKAKNRIDELERHDCKILKKEMFIDWR